MTLPSDIDPNFPATLWGVAKSFQAMGIVCHPVDLASSMFLESSIERRARNAEGCLGINQMCPGNFAKLGINPNTYTQLTESEQLCHYVFPFWKSIVASHHIAELSARDIEWLNYVPAYYVPNAPDSHVIMNSANPNYNEGFDHGNKGYITAGDIQTSIDKACSTARWFAIKAAILAADPSGPLVGGAAGTIIAGILFFIAYKLLGKARF